MKKLKVALVHDYLREYGGAERVVEALHEMFPDAPLYTAFVDREALGIHWERFCTWDIRESIAAKIPFIHHNIVFSPLRIAAAYFFEGFDFRDYDVVISSTQMYMSKAVLTAPSTLHLCYCHTPSRSLYGYTTMSNWKKSPLIRMMGELINYRLRTVDFMTAQRPDVMVANSKEVQQRIKKYYRRDSVVIYPPVSVVEAHTSNSKISESTEDSKLKTQSYYLYAGRITMSKHVDLAVRACVKLGRNLKVVGTGKGLEYLQGLADHHVEFVGSVSDEQLQQLYAQAKGLIFPSEDEDFGIVPVEAMMVGIPVIAHASGGPLETIIDGKTGVLFSELTTDGLVHALEKFESLKFDSKLIQKHAQQFSKENFQKKIQTLIMNSLRWCGKLDGAFLVKF